MDIGLFLSPDGATADLAIVNSDLATDASLQTAVLISLLTDRVADPNDTLPPNTTDRRGWWADAYIPALPDGSQDNWGSKLWLRRRCTATPQNAALIQADIEQALSWMIACGVATVIDVATAWVSATGLTVAIAITRTKAAQPSISRFDGIWNASTGQLTPS